jgi:hypothetical protein
LSLPETSAVKPTLLAIFDGTLSSGDRSNNAGLPDCKVLVTQRGSRGAAAGIRAAFAAAAAAASASASASASAPAA